MGCDVFDAANAGAQFFQANIGESCPAEGVCRKNCLLLDSSGNTSRGQALNIVQNKVWGKQQVEKFYEMLERRKSVPVVVMQALG